jgi:hypothetical protein
LRHCATSRKPKRVHFQMVIIVNFNRNKSFRPHYSRGFETDTKRNENNGYFLGGKGGRCVGLTSLPTFMYGLFRNSESLNIMEGTELAEWSR